MYVSGDILMIPGLLHAVKSSAHVDNMMISVVFMELDKGFAERSR
jgi:hypothetical protein